MSVPEAMSHEQAVELLPWLANDSLEVGEVDLVLAHAKSCVICRRELTQLESLQDSISQAAALTAIPAPDMRRLNARIDALIERENRALVVAAKLRELLGSPWRIAFAAQTVLLLVLAATLLWPDANNSEFSTLTVPEDLPDGHYVRVVFDPNLTATELSRLLNEMSLTVSAGPSNRGVYTLGIPDPASGVDRDAVVANLRANPGVLFAQPVRGAAGP